MSIQDLEAEVKRIRVHSWLLLQKFSLKLVEEINYKLVDVQPNKVVIVNTQRPNARIEVGFASA
jgi:hypothetical protein